MSASTTTNPAAAEPATKRAKKEKASFMCSCCHESKEVTEVDKGNSICSECGTNYGCFECSMDEGGWCGECKEYTCFGCPGHPRGCDECLEQLCEECGEFKPGKHRTVRCYRCQPWWQKNKPAGAFCRDCGSQRRGADFCEGCGARICEECEYHQCSSCSEEFYCDECNNDDLWCFKCLDDTEELVCKACCEGHGS